MNKLRISIYTSMTPFSETQTLSACASAFLDTLSDVLDKCLCFSLIKIVCLNLQSQAMLGSFLLICCIYFPIKIVLIKNLYMYVCLF